MKILTVDFEKKAGVDYSPGKKFLITLVVVTFTRFVSRGETRFVNEFGTKIQFIKVLLQCS